MLDLLLRNGRVVTASAVVEADIGIKDGKIAGVFSGGTSQAASEEVDISKNMVFPGAIDTHSHFFEPFPIDKEDFYHATMAAAAGGVTTCIEMPQSIPPVTDKESFEKKYNAASAKAVVDFAFWGGCGPQWLDNMDQLHELGCCAFKLFTSDAGPNYAMCDDYSLVKAMERAGRLKSIVGIHTENNAICQGMEEELRSQGKVGPEYHEQSRPVYGEIEAVKRVIYFAEHTKCPVMICHLGIPEAAMLVKQAKAKGIPVYMETCPHYLTLDDSAMVKYGSYAKVNPPLRDKMRMERLWDYVFDGTVDCIGSDHGVYTEAEKEQKEIFKAPGGFPGLDLMMNIMVSEGINKRGVSPERIAEMMSLRAARLFGLYPRKGWIGVGADADLAIVDLQRRWSFSYMDSFCKTRSTKYPYEGFEGIGKVIKTYVRGKLVYDEGEIKTEAGYGKYIKRY